MIKFVFKLLFVGLFVLLGFYFFLGSPEDKDRAKAVFAEVGDLFGEIGNFIMAEKAKFDKGEYEDELAKIRKLVEDIKAKASELSSLQQSADKAEAYLLDRKIDELERLVQKEELSEEEIEELKKRLAELQAEAEELKESSGELDLPKLL